MSGSRRATKSAQLEIETYDPVLWPYPIPAGDLVVRAELAINPRSKARPRFARNGRVYTEKGTRMYESAVALAIKAKLGGRPPDATSRFGMRAVFYRPTRQRIDCDNLLKAISDAANGVIWKDDAQCAEVFGRVFLASERPRVEVAFYTVEGEVGLVRVCPVCGENFRTYPSIDQAHCSMACANKAKRATVSCAWCSTAFEIPNCYVRRTQFCSRSCSSSFHGKKKTEASGPATWICKACGGPVSRREYVVCRGCSMKSRSDPTSNCWKLRYAKGLAKVRRDREDDPNNPRVEVEVEAANE